jgi:hypothetical protein
MGVAHHRAWLEIDQDGAGDVLATSGLVVVHVDALQLEAGGQGRGVVAVGAGWREGKEVRQRGGNSICEVLSFFVRLQCQHHHTRARVPGRARGDVGRRAGETRTQSRHGTFRWGQSRARRR